MMYGATREAIQGSCQGDHEDCLHHVSLRAVRRDLHDLVGGGLAGIATQLELLTRLTGADEGKAQDVLADLRAETVELIAHVRRLAHGRAVDSQVQNVEAALRSMTSQLNRALAPQLNFTLDYDAAVSLVGIEVRSAAFWISREAIINVVKHSRARHCIVSLAVSGGELRLRVEDDGPGRRTPSPGGTGLMNMAARAAQHGGWCCGSRLSPKGFALVARFPLTPEDIG
jgi:signal transduction histidine kinase